MAKHSPDLVYPPPRIPAWRRVLRAVVIGLPCTLLAVFLCLPMNMRLHRPTSFHATVLKAGDDLSLVPLNDELAFTDAAIGTVWFTDDEDVIPIVPFPFPIVHEHSRWFSVTFKERSRHDPLPPDDPLLPELRRQMQAVMASEDRPAKHVTAVLQPDLRIARLISWGVTLNIVFFLGVTAMIGGVIDAMRIEFRSDCLARRLANQKCPHCRYDMRGLTEPRCPECGARWERWQWPRVAERLEFCGRSAERSSSALRRRSFC